MEQNARSKTSKLYRSGEFYSLEPTISCLSADSEHIDHHKPEFYANITHLVAQSIDRTLEQRDQRGKYGLIDSGARPVKEIKDKRALDRYFLLTLSVDVESTCTSLPELITICDDHLDHIRSIDATAHPSTMSMMKGGLHTARDTFRTTYDVLRGPCFDLSEEQLVDSWRAVFDQANLNIKELLHLTLMHEPDRSPERMFNLDQHGLARFCADTIKHSTRIDTTIPDRQTVGCPLTFEVNFLRQLWEWYVTLHRSLTYSS